MPLGEGPITSYFPRLGKGKGKGKQSIGNAKRKHKKVIASVAESTSVAANVPTRTGSCAEGPGPSKKRCRKNTSCSLSSVSSESLPPSHDIFQTKSRKAKKNRSDGIDRTCSVISLEDDSDDGMNTRNDAGLSCSASDGRCLGLLSLNNVKGKGMMQRLQQPEHSVLSPFATSSKSRLKLPDGTIKRRPCSDPLHGPPSSSSGRDSMLVQDRPDEESEVVVLSSQTFERQEEHLYIPHSTGEGGVAGVDLGYNDVFTGIPEDTFLHRTPAQNDHCDLDDTELEIIKSSQTQNILLDYVSPQRHRTSKRFRVPNPLPSLSMTEDSVEMLVRSSQSQSEVGLSQLAQFGLDRRSECISNHSPSLDAPRSSSYREREGSRSRPPVRTYSDGLFSVPRRDDSFTELFAQDLTMRDSCLNKTTAESNGPPVQEDSETEPDTDDDTLDPYTMMNNLRQELSNPSSNEPSNGISESHSSDDNYTSLPEAVEEFRAMFGSDDSYPPDFPSSLRQ